MKTKTEEIRGMEERGDFGWPHDVDTQVSSELDEEVVHLTQVSGITVRIQESETGKRVFPEGGNDLVATLSVENVGVHVFVGGDTRQHHSPISLSANVVRRWLWREKREFGSHCSCHIAHLTLERANWNPLQHEPTQHRNGDLAFWALLVSLILCVGMRKKIKNKNSFFKQKVCLFEFSL